MKRVHIICRSRKRKNNPSIVATAWCGYQAAVGEILARPYRGPGGVKLVRLRKILYSAAFKVRLMPAEQLVGSSLADFADCPRCQQAYAAKRPILPIERVR